MLIVRHNHGLNTLTTLGKNLRKSWLKALE